MIYTMDIRHIYSRAEDGLQLDLIAMNAAMSCTARSSWAHGLQLMSCMASRGLQHDQPLGADIFMQDMQTSSVSALYEAIYIYFD